MSVDHLPTDGVAAARDLQTLLNGIAAHPTGWSYHMRLLAARVVELESRRSPPAKPYVFNRADEESGLARDLAAAESYIEQLRDPLLNYFGTTDPELLAEIWRDQAGQSSLGEGTDTAMAKLDEIAALPENWDSYGAGPPWPDAIATARRIVTLFQHAPAIVPLSDGGVQLEWYREGFELEVRVEPHGEVDPDISLDHARSQHSTSETEKK